MDDSDRAVRYYKRDFWSKENLKHSSPHYRLEKSARLINRLAGGNPCTLLDIGCGPATLMQLLRPNIDYYGIDIAIQEPAPNLIEADLLASPIKFGDKRFDMVVALGVFEYFGEFQAQKFAEIAQLLTAGGTFMISYTNFGHRKRSIYWPYSNIRSLDDFRSDLAHHFDIRKSFPTAHNWNHGLPNRRLAKAANMHINLNLPIVSQLLAVEYYFFCSPREAAAS